MTEISQAVAYDTIIVGAGFAGMFMLHRLRGLGRSACIIEAAGGVGGTWYWNRYPGARCDVESMQYSYAFDAQLQQDWHWSERFAAQPEILRYAEHVAQRLDLRRDIVFNTRVTQAVYDDNAGVWRVRTDQGAALTARFCIMATGCLSAARRPDLPGLETFKGRCDHTGEWPHEGVDFTGKRVAVIGTGSSGIQSIPVIAREAAQVVVFQRTPNFCVPSRNRDMDEPYEQSWKRDYAALRQKARKMRTGILFPLNDQSALDVTEEERRRIYEQRWEAGSTAFMAAFNDLITNKQANDTAVAFVHDKIRALVKDPIVAEKLLPRSHPIGTKRLCVDTEYYQTYNRDNVTLVDLRTDPIETVTAAGIRAGGVDYTVDHIVFATGFDAMTGALLQIDIRGRQGERLADKWADGPRTYLGLMAAGFPNFFMITGPGSPSVLSNMMVSIDQHVEWLTQCLSYMKQRGFQQIEPSQAAEDAWVLHGSEVAHRTLYPSAASWYMGANVPGKPRVFMPYIGGVGVYRERCDEIAADGYTGFIFNGEPAQIAAE
jgi:cyclohexanone monooxygenase